MKQLALLFVFLFFVCGSYHQAVAQTYDMQVKKIWDNGKHSAFTSLIKYQGRYYCSFREGYSHVFDEKGDAEGEVRIIASSDGENWESVVCMQKPTIDLRDPKLSVMPDGRLMVIMGGSVYRNKVLEERIPQVSFSSDGKTFTDPIPIQLEGQSADKSDWLWRVTWEGDTGYGVNYYQDTIGKYVISLVKTTDGINYQPVSILDVSDYPNESTVRFLDDKRMLIMVRREAGDKMGYWGVSHPPYKEWTWTKMEMQLGGPDFIVRNNGQIIAGTRSYYVSSYPKTVLLKGTPDGKFQEVCVLPSGGDTSYPGFLIEGEYVWVCYYSTHETPKASVYLAKIPLSLFK